MRQNARIDWSFAFDKNFVALSQFMRFSHETSILFKRLLGRSISPTTSAVALRDYS
ncbi:hypothetical protein AFE_0887 [Acidithiobacillus ferrooxidans ATCC 23270]|uniref:Uncharacterized protein n=1 Tax=Acidithiobacillus ferrooxidans (strain ATCC 23270 / DSM 14882 / CIP 104768 / NCIMB 8455) TaxID=243159 RepID=B7J6U5_ACIF2|nr:hypothetical protein AFE_0887 [Acidithiobacillus ferrooxidans ATCC 23270]